MSLNTTQRNDLWEAALAEWQLHASSVEYGMVFKKLFIKDISGTNHYNITIATPSLMWQSEIKTRYDTLITETLQRLFGKPVMVNYIVETQSQKKEDISNTPLFSNTLSKNEHTFHEQLKRLRLDPERSLDDFAVSSSNEMAYAAAKAVADLPGSAYNPLFLYGDVGVGKTHLMQGIGQLLFRKDMSMKIIYCSGEDFTNGIIEAIQKKSTIAFRNKYRSVKLLLIDDIQFIAGKNSVQEEFFHTFNAITTAGGQVIMTSDKPPKEIDSLEDRLRSRFEGGLTVDIGEPNFELRCAIIMIKSSKLKLDLSTEVVQFLASNEEGTRALIGKLLMLVTMSQQNNEPITIDFARRYIKDTELEQEKTAPPTFDEVVTAVSEHYNQSVYEVLGKSRVKTLTLPRHMAMYLLHSHLGTNLVTIGKRFSNRDHTSVLHAVKKLKKLLATEGKVTDEVNSLRLKLRL